MSFSKTSCVCYKYISIHVYCMECMALSKVGVDIVCSHDILQCYSDNVGSLDFHTCIFQYVGRPLPIGISSATLYLAVSNLWLRVCMSLEMDANSCIMTTDNKALYLL